VLQHALKGKGERNVAIETQVKPKVTEHREKRIGQLQGPGEARTGTGRGGKTKKLGRASRGKSSFFFV